LESVSVKHTRVAPRDDPFDNTDLGHALDDHVQEAGEKRRDPFSHIPLNLSARVD